MTGKDSYTKNDLKIPAINIIYGVLLCAAALALLIFGIRSMGLGRRDANNLNVRPFSEGWKAEDGCAQEIEGVRVDHTGRTVVYNTLPDDLSDDFHVFLLLSVQDLTNLIISVRKRNIYVSYIRFSP